MNFTVYVSCKSCNRRNRKDMWLIINGYTENKENCLYYGGTLHLHFNVFGYYEYVSIRKIANILGSFDG